MKKHYEWIVVGVGTLALIGALAFWMMSGDTDENSAVSAVMSRIERMKPAKVVVEAIDKADYLSAVKLTKNPASLTAIAGEQENFLASERRVKCKKCSRSIVGDPKKFPKCPFCGEAQEAAETVVADADNDGMADEWEKRYGLNPANDDSNQDKDGDGFTNLEEYEAKTDPTDKKSHPDYLDSVTIQLPLKETYVPFVFRKGQQIPAGWRLEFFDPNRLNGFGRKGVSMMATVGEELGDLDKTYKTGFLIKNYEPKTAKVAVPGTEGMTRDQDVSEVTIERIKDKKIIKLVAQERTAKLTPIDVQATLVYTRGESKTFEVVTGSEIELNQEKYQVVEIKPVGNQAEVTFKNTISGKKRTLKTLE